MLSYNDLNDDGGWNKKNNNNCYADHSSCLREPEALVQWLPEHSTAMI